MQDFVVNLSSEPSTSFRCKKAADSLDIDVTKKLTHSLKVSADLDGPFNVGLIVGASGSGKTTLARSIAPYDFEQPVLDLSLPVIDQFPDAMTYDQCAKMLTSVGLTAVPCWIRPAGTLSNGQRARAEVAIQLCQERDVLFIDEWTSVVDRTVAKVMSHSIQKTLRKTGRRAVILSCHYDVIDWLEPDWIIDCNKQSFSDRRLERPGRQEQLAFDVRPCDPATWAAFSRYHYLSEKMPGGHVETFGLYHGVEQIGFTCFANYVPHKPGKQRIMHSNRAVIHPDYVGLGLGMRLIDATSAVMTKRGFRVMAKFSSIPLLKARLKNPNWALMSKSRDHKITVAGSMTRSAGFRMDVTTYQFAWRGGDDPAAALSRARAA